MAIPGQGWLPVGLQSSVDEEDILNDFIPVEYEAYYYDGPGTSIGEGEEEQTHTERSYVNEEADVHAGISADDDTKPLQIITLRRTEAYGVILLDSTEGIEVGVGTFLEGCEDPTEATWSNCPVPPATSYEKVAI